MELLFLGTGAADWPQETCAQGDERGLDRRCTSVLVDGELLIDPGPNVPEALGTFGADPSKIRSVIISHSHDDHFNPGTLTWLADQHPIDVYGASGYEFKLPKHQNLTFHVVESSQTMELPFGTLIAAESTHLVEDTNEKVLHYILVRNGKRLLYATDGAWFTSRTWGILGRYAYDCVILDATFGDDSRIYRIKSRGIFFYHNNLSMVRAIQAAFMDRKNAAQAHTVFVADHLAKAYYPDIETARATFGATGIVAAYDGMRLTL